MDIHGENSFKSRSYSAAAFNIEKLPEQLNAIPREKLAGIKGIGESAAKKIIEILDTGKLSALDEIISKTPVGVIEMLQIKGLGPKKIATIWKEMQLESIGELLYACNENRLLLYKGFGEKTQQNVQEAIEFYFQNQGSFLYAEVEALYPGIVNYLEKLFGASNVHVTGAYRRQELTIDELEFIVNQPKDTVRKAFQTAYPPELLEEQEELLVYKLKNGLKLKLYTNSMNFTERLFTTTATADFLLAFKNKYPQADYSTSEKHLFEKLKLPFIPAYVRETSNLSEAIEIASIPAPIHESDIKGIIHSHSNWSDGLNTIEEMANACIEKKMEFLVISDHSKAAAYAGGLSEDKISQQHAYIDELNAKLSPFKIFKSIECDILGDGSMDYSDQVLSTFDLVIASIHSNLKMPQDKAMMRILKAVANPYTTILGHMTGRLLLSRNGYPVDHQQVIEACKEHQVVIELNAHPRRLDIDWRWIQPAIRNGVLISINPDAHHIDGYKDCKYGVLSAQKGGLTKNKNLSSFSLKEFESYLLERRKRKKIN